MSGVKVGIGSAVPRLEARQKVTGQAAYAADTRFPDQLYAGILRCPFPHARVRSVDASAAEAIDGVHVVLTGANAPGLCWYKEEAPLFGGICRFAGDEVAAVAAESEDLLAEALAAIRVDYEQRPFVVDLAESQEASAPLVYDGSNSNRVAEPDVYERGSIDEGFARADCIIEQTYDTQCAVHNAMEPHGCTADWHDGQLILWASTQGIHAVRSGIAKILDLRDDQVRVISKYMGGGFGAKQIDWKQTLIAALLARECGRPVQLMLDRAAENLAVGNRNATRQQVRIGATSDGRLCAISAVISCAAGAYRVAGEASNVAGIYQLLYKCDNVHTEQTFYYTNTGPSVAFRAPGFAEGAFGLEQAVDELARKLSIDPFDLRRRNYTDREQKKDLPYSSPSALAECCDRLQPEFRNAQRPERRATRLRRGTGVAVCIWIGGSANPPAAARVRLYRHGSAEVFTGTQDIGTGTRTVLTQIAADVLGYPPGQLRLQLGDTDTGTYAPTSGGSTTVATLGPAVWNAATNALANLRKACGVAATAPADVAELVTRIDGDYMEGCGECPPKPDDVAVVTFGAQVAEVDVDTVSGEISVVRLRVAADCGRVINPLLAKSQVMGGAIQGMGYALTEQRIVDDRLGLVMNANLEEYHVPTAADIPAIEYVGVDRPDESASPTGAKGLGEPPLIPTAAAIANAVFDATGIRCRQLPLSRERMLLELQRQLT